eukprot:2857428-Pyramimonas_sp.AAC.1
MLGRTTGAPYHLVSTSPRACRPPPTHPACLVSCGTTPRGAPVPRGNSSDISIQDPGLRVE